jgi:predicted outer membrane repeat protein
MDGIKLMLSRRALLLLAVTAFGVFGMAGTAMAGSTFTVTDLNDYPQATPNSSATDPNWGKCVSIDTSGGCTLRAAVEAADELGGPSTITLPSGTIKFKQGATGSSTGYSGAFTTSSEDPSQGDLDINPLDNTTTITINGAGSGKTIINANSLDRAFAIEYFSSGNKTVGGLTLSGLTIENGSPSSHSYDGSSYAGAIYSDGALTLSNDVVLTGNGAGDYGGAIYADSDTGSTVSITGSTLSNNVTDDYAGAIYDDSPNTMSISKTLLDNNAAATYGGAIAVKGTGGIKLDSSTFTLNTTEEYAGAIYWASSTGGALTATNSTFSDNNGPYIGGAVLDYGSSGMSFTSTRFTGNSAGYDDGGSVLYLDSNYTTTTPQYTLNQVEMDHNSSAYYGPVTWYAGNLDIHSSSFIHNDGMYDGGAIFADCSSCSFTLVNSTIAQNTAQDGGGIDFNTTTEVAMTNDTIVANSGPGTGGSSGEGGGIYGASHTAIGSYTLPAGDTSEAAGVENVVIAQNYGGDCDSSDAFPGTVEPNGHNLDDDGTCFTSGASGDASKAISLPAPADNGGPTIGDTNSGLTGPLLTISDIGTPLVGAGATTGCPSDDERGVPRSGSCDVGAYQSAAAKLTVTDSAPSSASPGGSFNDTVTVANGGPGFSTGTAVVAAVPAGETLYAVTPSQGSCSPTSAAGPALVSCSLGTMASGASATVTLTVSATKTVTNAAGAKNDEGGTGSASAVTTVKSTSVTPPPKRRVIGRLVLLSPVLRISHNNLAITFVCASNATCAGLFSVTIHVKTKGGKTATAVCTVSRRTFYRIGAGSVVTLHRPVHSSCVTAIRRHDGRLAGKVTSRPRTGQQGLVNKVTVLA